MSPGSRIVALDQFRGYTVAGMFLVNFLGSFAVIWPVLKHHNSYCSYADTIMPQFLFAVGFALRLTFVRRAAEQGLAAAYWRMAPRVGGLVLLSLVIYTIHAGALSWSQFTESGWRDVLAAHFKRHWFQTLMHIAVTSLWILPVLRAGVLVRVAYMALSAAAHVVLSDWFNFEWVNTPPNGIDGGPLGFLTWTIPALVGTFACDIVLRTPERGRLGRMLVGSVVLMVLGYLFSCGTRLYDVPDTPHALPLPKLADSPVVFSWKQVEERDFVSLLAEPPFVPPPPPAERQWNYWMMSQRSGSLSYLTFAAGFSLAVFALFYLACDRWGGSVPWFRTLGSNALAAYILGGLVEEAVKPFVPRDAPLWYVLAGFVLSFACTYVLIRHLEKKGIMLRL